MSELHLTGLTKTFDGHTALDDVSLEARDGELLTLLGPSGCGKSTTLWSIAGLHRPDAGTIRIGDQVVFDAAAGTMVAPERRECGVVFQSYAIWPHLTVAENVSYPLRLRRVNRKAQRARVDEVLELVELAELGQRYPHQLSGGQQQRVALARALAHPPRILLLDEPFSNFDAKLRDRARLWLRALQQELGVTTIFVTHDQDEALSVSDRVAVMADGVVRQVGSPQDVYDEPVDLFVADFVGTINVLDATVVGATAGGSSVGGDGSGSDQPDRLDVRIDGLAEPLSVTPAGADSLRGKVTVAVRPEQILIGTPDELADVPGAACVPIIDQSYLGDHYRYRVQLGDALVTVQSTHAVPGDGPVAIAIPPGRGRAFPHREAVDG